MNEHDFGVQWNIFIHSMETFLGKKPDINAILFLIGIQEYGAGNRTYTKEQKQDLMNLATFKLLSELGHYQLTGYDDENWPIYVPLAPLPLLSLHDQEKLLKIQILEYFEEIGWEMD